MYQNLTAKAAAPELRSERSSLQDQAHMSGIMQTHDDETVAAMNGSSEQHTDGHFSTVPSKRPSDEVAADLSNKKMRVDDQTAHAQHSSEQAEHGSQAELEQSGNTEAQDGKSDDITVGSEYRKADNENQAQGNDMQGELNKLRAGIAQQALQINALKKNLESETADHVHLKVAHQLLKSANNQLGAKLRSNQEEFEQAVQRTARTLINEEKKEHAKKLDKCDEQWQQKFYKYTEGFKQAQETRKQRTDQATTLEKEKHRDAMLALKEKHQTTLAEMKKKMMASEADGKQFRENLRLENKKIKDEATAAIMKAKDEAKATKPEHSAVVKEKERIIKELNQVALSFEKKSLEYLSTISKREAQIDSLEVKVDACHYAIIERGGRINELHTALKSQDLANTKLIQTIKHLQKAQESWALALEERVEEEKKKYVHHLQVAHDAKQDVIEHRRTVFRLKSSNGVLSKRLTEAEKGLSGANSEVAALQAQVAELKAAALQSGAEQPQAQMTEAQQPQDQQPPAQQPQVQQSQDQPLNGVTSAARSSSDQQENQSAEP